MPTAAAAVLAFAASAAWYQRCTSASSRGGRLQLVLEVVEQGKTSAKRVHEDCELGSILFSLGHQRVLRDLPS